MDDSVFTSLTPRERECLRGVRALMGSGEIGRKLGIATGTVDAYIGTARAKLGARDRKHAALMLAEHEGARDLDVGIAPQKLAYENLGLAGGAVQPPSLSSVGGDRLSGTLNDFALDRRRFGDPPTRTNWRGIFGEIIGGARPSDLSIMTRGMLILSATVIIGFSFFTVSALAGALFGLARYIQSLSN